MTEARVSQIRSEAIASMRAWMGTMYDGVPTVEEGAPGSRRRASYLATMQAHATWQDCLSAANTPTGASLSA